MTTVFNELPEALRKALEAAFEITEPMPVQEASYPLIAAGKNVVLQSRTGSGKTLAYLLPFLAKMTPGESGNRLLVVAPTQELAVQIANIIRAINAKLEGGYSIALCGGGANINHQIDKLKGRPAIIVGTPGRLLELFDRRKINGQTIEAVIFDEVDAIIAQEKGSLMKHIQKKLLKSVQVVAVSASISMEAQQLLRGTIENAEFLIANEEAALNPNIGHFMLRCEARKKFDNLRRRFALPKDKQIKDFSTGMRAKLNIAVALCHSAQLLILDEATSGLDPVVRDEILDILQDFVQDENKSVLISSHITSDLEKICDYIAFIKDGEIVFVENKDDLMEKYAVIHCTNEQFSQLDPSAVISHRQNSFSTQALVFKDKLCGEYVMDKPSIEDIMLYYTKEVQ